MNSVEDKDPKAADGKRYSLLLKYLAVPDEQRFASMSGFGKRKG